MRTLPVEPVAAAPDFVLGVSIIRGAPVPVVDAGRLLGGGDSRPARLVTVRLGGRQLALAVDDVLGARALGGARRDVPPLLADAGRDVVSAIGCLDAELLLFLEAVRILPDAVWDALQAEGSRS